MTVLVLGIGNILWADEGFGVRAVEAFHRRYELPDDVVLLDGGTQGLYLVNYVQEADDLLVFDAIDYGLTPGTLKIVRDQEVPKFTGAKKMSLHQTGFPGGSVRRRSAGRLSKPVGADRLSAGRSGGLGRPADRAGVRRDRPRGGCGGRRSCRLGGGGKTAHSAAPGE